MDLVDDKRRAWADGPTMSLWDVDLRYSSDRVNNEDCPGLYPVIRNSLVGLAPYLGKFRALNQIGEFHCHSFFLELRPLPGYATFCSRSHDAVIRVYDKAGKVIQTGIKFNEKSFRFTTQMRDFTTIDVTVFATKMIPLLRGGFDWNSPISLIGIRAALEPSPAENRMDVYDDIILRVIDGSITQWVTSTDPSKALVMTPIKGQKYAAQLCKGIYLFREHLMHGKYPCLGQAEDVGIERLNRDGTVNHTEKGQFGICIHSGGAGMNTGRFSAGCQIIDNPDGYFRDPTWSNFWLPIRNGMKEHDLPTIPYMLVDVGDLG